LTLLLMLMPQLATPEVVTTAFQFNRDVEQIILGDTQSVTIDVQASHQGAALDDKLPTLTTSVGTLSGLERTGPGRYRVRFQPPPSRYPQVAMISATTQVGQTSFIGLSVLPLWGTAVAGVKTKPRSDVEVVVKTSIGPLRFGPIRADKDGRANVPLLLPPGVLSAATRSRDDAGNVSERAIDLGIPAFNQLSLLAIDKTVAADGNGRASMVVFATNAQGTAEVTNPLQWQVQGEQANVEARPIGMGMSLASVAIAASRATHMVVRVTTNGGQAETQLRLIPGPVAKARLSTVSQVGLDDDKLIAVPCVVVDAADNIVPMDAVSVDVDRGRIEQVAHNADGSVVLLWRLPEDWQPGSLASLQLRTAVVIAAVEVKLAAGRLAGLDISAPPAITADGSSTAALEVRGHDRLGNPVQLDDISASAPGVHAVVERQGDGARVTLTAAALDDERQVNITISSGGLTQQVPWRLLARSKDLLLAPFIGVSTGFGAASAAGLTLELLARLPIFDGSTFVGLSSSALWGVPVLDNAFAAHRSIGMSGRFGWRPTLTPWLGVHVGSGLGVMLTERATRNGGAALGTAVTAGLSAGPWLPVGPGAVELHADVDASYTIESSVPAPVGVGLWLGYRQSL
jgi:hypothetical protein